MYIYIYIYVYMYLYPLTAHWPPTVQRAGHSANRLAASRNETHNIVMITVCLLLCSQKLRL